MNDPDLSLTNLIEIIFFTRNMPCEWQTPRHPFKIGDPPVHYRTGEILIPYKL